MISEWAQAEYFLYQLPHNMYTLKSVPIDVLVDIEHHRKVTIKTNSFLQAVKIIFNVRSPDFATETIPQEEALLLIEYMQNKSNIDAKEYNRFKKFIQTLGK